MLFKRSKESGVMGQPLWVGEDQSLSGCRAWVSVTQCFVQPCACSKEPTGWSSCSDAWLIWQRGWFCQVTVWELSPASNPLPYPCEELGGGWEEGGKLSGDFLSLLAWKHFVIISSRIAARGWLSIMSSAQIISGPLSRAPPFVMAPRNHCITV